MVMLRGVMGGQTTVSGGEREAPMLVLVRERLQAERKGEIELVPKVDEDKWGVSCGCLACFFARNLQNFLPFSLCFPFGFPLFLLLTTLFFQFFSASLLRDSLFTLLFLPCFVPSP